MPSVAKRAVSVTDEVMKRSAPGESAYLGSYNKSLDYQRIDPSANVQTGPGLPRWQWRQLTLGWNGPVSKDQAVSLTLLSPWQNRVIHALRILLLLALVVLLTRDREAGGPKAWLKALRLKREARDHA